MAKIQNRDDFQLWLAGKPREISIVLGAHIALRALPLIGAWKPSGNREIGLRNRLTPAAFRAAAVALAAARYPTEDDALRSIADAARANARIVRTDVYANIAIQYTAADPATAIAAAASDAAQIVTSEADYICATHAGDTADAAARAADHATEVLYADAASDAVWVSIEAVAARACRAPSLGQFRGHADDNPEAVERAPCLARRYTR